MYKLSLCRVIYMSLSIIMYYIVSCKSHIVINFWRILTIGYPINFKYFAPNLDHQWLTIFVFTHIVKFILLTEKGFTIVIVKTIQEIYSVSRQD